MGEPVTIYWTRGGRGDTERLLAAAAADWLGEAAPALLRTARTERGKPFFPERTELCCSVTHSGGYWLCALSARPLGLDLERERPVDAARLARRFFLPEEADWLERRPEDFFLFWTAKESLVKYAGTGLPGHLRDVSLLRGGALTDCVGPLRLTRLPFAPGFVLTLCTEGEAEVTIKELTGEGRGENEE